jgi:16S rRNA (adenine1518-N6/adenine1519-N6)-dimethyltransferase
LDDILFSELQIRQAKTPNIELIKADVLKIDLSALLQSNSRRHTKIVANLPYYITTPVLLKFLELRLLIQTCVLMVQEEVAQRIVAPPGNKTYGSLSVVVNYHAEPKIILKVPATSFYPRPKVDSALLLLRMREKPKCLVENEDLFFQVVRGAFQHRRKTLRNSLRYSSLLIPLKILDKAFKRLKLDSQRRGETLSIEEFADLANCLYEI